MESADRLDDHIITMFILDNMGFKVSNYQPRRRHRQRVAGAGASSRRVDKTQPNSRCIDELEKLAHCCKLTVANRI